MDFKVGQQVTEIRDLMHSMQDNLKSFQSDMGRRFVSHQEHTNLRIDALQAFLGRHTKNIQDQFGPLDRRVDGFAERVDKRIDALDRDLRLRLSNISDSLTGLKPSIQQGFATIEERLRLLDEQSTQQSERLRHMGEQSAKRFDEKLQFHDHQTENHVNEVAERLNGRLDNVSHNMGDRWSLVEGKLMNLENRLDNASLATLDGNIRQVSMRIEELKAVVHAGHVELPIPFPHRP
ncbi:MAG: hypothetical protein Q9188_007220 [Gyalolechia gomerana]